MMMTIVTGTGTMVDIVTVIEIVRDLIPLERQDLRKALYLNRVAATDQTATAIASSVTMGV